MENVKTIKLEKNYLIKCYIKANNRKFTKMEIVKHKLKLSKNRQKRRILKKMEITKKFIKQWK